MSLFYKILEEQEQLLKKKGFDEFSLDAPERSGWFMRQLRLNFSLSYTQAHQYNEPVEFLMKAVGFFSDRMDIVTFHLNYEYNPEKIELRIKELTANCGTEKQIFVLNRNEDLPASGTIYKNFSCAQTNERLGKAKLISKNTENIIRRAIKK